MSKSRGTIFTIMGGMLLPVGIVFLLLLKQQFLGVVFIVLGLGNLLLAVLINSKDREQE